MSQRLEQKKAPPAEYYANNVLLLLAAVLNQYGDILTVAELSVINKVQSLSTSAIRLFARLLSRSRPLLLCDSLNYAEVDDREAALDELQQHDLIERDHDVPADQILSLLTVQTLKQIYQLVPHTTPKQQYVNHIACRYRETRHLDLLKLHCSWVEIAVHAELELFGLLFFGDLHHDFSSFVVRDLGIVRYENYSIDSASRQFSDREILDRYLELVALNRWIHENADNLDSITALSIIDLLKQGEDERLLERLRSRTLNRLARGLERQNENATAIQAYSISSMHPARERSMRVLSKLQQDCSMERLRSRILSDPWTEEERRFAIRFRRRNNNKTHFPTTVVKVNEESLAGVEMIALDWLIEAEGAGWHLENSLPMSLFGLAYWEWIFAPIEGAFVNPFQVAPKDLFWPEFFRVRQDRVPDPLDSRESLKAVIYDTAMRKEGIANALVDWQSVDRFILAKILDALPDDALAKLLRIVRKDLAQMRAGFPDLTIIYDDNRFEFVEVKGPNDQLQENQKIWLTELIDNELPARVLRLASS